MLHYAMLNVTRAVLATPAGEFCSRRHGLSYVADSSLLDCAARATAKGTFVQFISALGFETDLTTQQLTLRDLLAQIPEMRADFSLFDRGHSAVAIVRVKAFMAGDVFLHFMAAGLSEDDFRQNWETLFPCLLAIGR